MFNCVIEMSSEVAVVEQERIQLPIFVVSSPKIACRIRAAIVYHCQVECIQPGKPLELQ